MAVTPCVGDVVGAVPEVLELVAVDVQGRRKRAGRRRRD